jgi:predicted PurR-regulated permease PerM
MPAFPDAPRPGPPVRRSSRARQQVPIRTILATVGLVLATGAAIEVVLKLHPVLIWVGIAAFFAVVLHPAVDLLVRRLHLGRVLAALVVFVIGAAVLSGVVYVVARPIVNQVNAFVNDFPRYVADARAGRGTIGHIVKRYNIDTYIDKNQAGLKAQLKTAEKPAVHLARTLFDTLTAVATIVVITFLMLIEGPRMIESGLATLSPARRPQVEQVLHDAARALAGYVGGNLGAGIIAGGVAYVSFMWLGVPFRSVLAVWIGFTTVIPLVGALIGALPAIGVAFIHSTPAGIATIVILIVYQQIENRFITKRIMARTVALTPLAAVVSVMAGYELLGLLGVVLAIPAAGIINVVVRDVWHLRRAGRARPAERAVWAPEGGV